MFDGLLQPTHLLLILAFALLIFGPKKLPELGKGLANGIKGFKAAMNGDSEKITTEAKSTSIVDEGKERL